MSETQYQLLLAEADLLTEALQLEHEKRVQAEELLWRISRSSKPTSYIRAMALEYLESQALALA